MNFTDKYVSTAEKDEIINKDKIVLSNDAFAVSEMLDKLRRVMELKNG